MITTGFLLIILCVLPQIHAYKTSHNNILSKLTAFFVTATVLSSPVPATAQIPSTDDFYTTSGTIVRPKVTVAPPTEDISLNTLDDFKKILNKLEVLSTNEKWDDVITIDNKIKKIFSDKSILPSGVKDDILFDIGSLNDLSLQNRITYFSKEDLKQISGLIDEQGDGESTKNEEAIKEALQIIQDIRKLLN